MNNEKKFLDKKELEKKNEQTEISENQLDEIVGGVFSDIPRVPQKNIDDALKDKV